MSEFEVTNATLDDWADIKQLVLQLGDSKFSAIVGATPEEAQGFLINSITHPAGVGLLLLRWQGRAVGLCALMAMNSPKPGTLGVYAETQVHCFIHSVYIRPSYGDGQWATKVPPEGGNHMMLGIEEWARARRAVWIYGNVRLDGRFGGFWRKFGMGAQHGVAGKGVSPGVEELPGLELHQVVVGKEV